MMLLGKGLHAVRWITLLNNLFGWHIVAPNIPAKPMGTSVSTLKSCGFFIAWKKWGHVMRDFTKPPLNELGQQTGAPA